MSAIPNTDKIPKYAVEVIRTLKEAGHTAYLVGGCVRDLFMSRSPNDFDVATSARPEQVKGLFKKVLDTGILHGTVTVMNGTDKVEVTTYRGEGKYTDGRRPDDVKFLDTIEGDLARRDFSMNSIAYDPIGDMVVDPYNGRHDISQHLIRCVGNPMDRFGEDGLRPLRAVRFASTMVNMTIELETYKAIGHPTILATYEKVAIERVMEEFRKILTAQNVKGGLRFLVQTKLMDRIFPSIGTWADEVLEHLYSALTHSASVYESNFALVCHQHRMIDGKMPVLENLKLPTQFISQVTHLSRFGIPIQIDRFHDAQLRRYAAEVKRENISAVMSMQSGIVCAYEGDRDPAKVGVAASWVMARKRLDEILMQKPPLTTKDLALNGEEIGAIVGKGPKIGKSLKFLMELVLEDPAQNTKALLSEALRETTKPQEQTA